MISLTDKAKEKLKEIANEEGISYSIRIKITGGGCGGTKNDMMFDNNPTEMDEIITIDDIQILVDQLSLQYFNGTTIDFIDDGFQSGFKFINPNTTGSCGCGKSVKF